MEANVEPGEAWTIERGELPIIATAIHAGHAVRPEVVGLFEISEDDRLREEDPFTDQWIDIASNRVNVHRSRFEVDLNRPREKAIYLEPADSFDLKVWRATPSKAVCDRSLQVYDGFYEAFRKLCNEVESAYRRFVVLDLHSYNHRRSGPDAPVDDPEKNPEINVGTGSMDRIRWGGLVDRFMKDLSEAPFDGGYLDVRENVRFQGGYLSRWVHENYPSSGCALAVEVKKIFMDEWTGLEDEAAVVSMSAVLRSTVPGLLEELDAAG